MCVVRAGLLNRIRIIFVSWIWIRMREKSWIRIPIKVKIQKLFLEAQLEPWTPKWRPGGSTWSLVGSIPSTLMRSKIRIRFKVKNRIRIQLFTLMQPCF